MYLQINQIITEMYDSDMNFFMGFNSLRPSDAYMRQWTNHHWIR